MSAALSNIYKTQTFIVMEEKHGCHCGVKLGFEIAKTILKAAGVAAAFCIAKEMHKVHKSIEKRERR